MEHEEYAAMCQAYIELRFKALNLLAERRKHPCDERRIDEGVPSLPDAGKPCWAIKGMHPEDWCEECVKAGEIHARYQEAVASSERVWRKLRKYLRRRQELIAGEQR